MKKSVFGILALVVMAVCFWSCGGGNTPSKVVEKSIEYVKAKNYEAYVDLIQIEEKKGKSVEEQKEQLLALLHGKLGPTLDKNQGIASCEIPLDLRSKRKVSKKCYLCKKLTKGER